MALTSMTKENACPICKSPAVPKYAPFCSRRCADIDLHRWLSGGYAVPATENDGESTEVEKED